MRINVILRYVGLVVLLNAVFMVISAAVSLLNGIDTAFYPLLLSAVITVSLGAFPLVFVEKSGQITMKEGYMIVVLSWLVACLMGTFPYLLWSGEFDFATAWFESVSGFTTTGATAIHNVETLPRGLLFWRSSTHWLGGVGVVMFAMLILPSLGRNKLTLSSAELSPLAKDNYRFRTQKIVHILVTLYVCMTAAAAILLRIAGMDWFDSVNHAFSTMSTGGFSTRTASIGHYDSIWIEMIVMVFMLLSGVHFGLLYATFTGKRNNMFRSEVTRFYFGTVLVAAALISTSIWRAGVYDTFGESVRHGLFQTASIITTTGFATADTNLWTPLAIVILIFLTFQCACAGSTAGGIKSDRIWMSFKVFKARMLRQQHPNAVIRIKINNVPQEDSVVNYAMFFIVLYVLSVVLGTLVVTAAGIDIQTGFSMVAACMGNVGPGFGSIGSMSDYAHMTPFIKVFCSIFMLLGRLEIFGFIQLFMIRSWR